MARFRVTATTLNVRSTPNADSKANIKMQLKRGVRVEAAAPPLDTPADSAWVWVKFKVQGVEEQGFVAKRFLIALEPSALGWRLGVNMREFAYFGTPVVQFTGEALQEQQLSELKAMGAKQIRFFTSHVSMNTAQTVARVQKAVQKINSFGLKAILCLSDGLGSGFFPRGDEQWHNQPHGHLHKDYFKQQHYRQNFIPLSRAILEGVAENPAVFMVELGNEYAIHPQPATAADADAFVAFCDEAGEMVKSFVPRARVSTGLVNTNHIAAPGKRDALARKLYALDSMDVVSIHFYQHDDEKGKADHDASIARALKKPYYIGEVGAFSNTGNRAGYFDSEISEWKGKGAFMVMPWGFDVSTKDVGISDELALAGRFGDFGDCCTILRKYTR